MHAHLTLVRQLVHDLTPVLPHDFQFSLVEDTWDDVLDIEFRTHGQSAGTWVSLSDSPCTAAQKVVRDLRAFLLNEQLFAVPLLPTSVQWHVDCAADRARVSFNADIENAVKGPALPGTAFQPR